MAREQFMISVEFIDNAIKADFAALGVWLSLSAYSAPRLLGGRLKGAKAWTDQMWIRGPRVDRASAELAVVADLAWWEGDDLVLGGYDLNGEKLWRRQSKGGRDGAEKRYSRRGSESLEQTPTHEDTQQETYIGDQEGDPVGDLTGLPMRDSDSDSEGDSEASSESERGARESDARSARRAREGLSESAEARLLAACDAGAWMVDRKTGESLHGAWREALGDFTPEQVAKGFAQAKRLTGHEIRYPSGFVKVVEARRAEVARQAENREARTQAEDRAKRVERDRDDTEKLRAMSRRQIDAVEAWFATPTGDGVRKVIDESPILSKRWAQAKRHAQSGAGANLSLVMLSRELPAMCEPLDAMAES